MSASTPEVLLSASFDPRSPAERAAFLSQLRTLQRTHGPGGLLAGRRRRGGRMEVVVLRAAPGRPAAETVCPANTVSAWSGHPGW